MSIALTDIVLTYPDGDSTVTALDHVSLEARPGELHAIVGPSGSGKSSLLAVASTLIRPDSGSVRIDGTEAAELSPAERSRLRMNRVGIVFQQPNLVSSLTAAEQLLVTDHMRGRPVRSHRAAAERLLAVVGLDGKQHRRPAQLSGGERQRVNIARALTGDPRVLLVDEPTAALDHDRGARIMDLLAEITTEYRVATFVVTHDTEYLDRADTVSTMRDGRLTTTGGAPRPERSGAAV
ncbi:putative ABC transport system ATP-binding protein [Nocardiopsis mwathae]|uniref:Putative ABC transport system ATP-binding protein n=1 Tax=Nocardiopsis mwathae TaxID=1472723 RepID=A0A7W9YKH0_9ACTN|nr:ABC transporter ATP-binding protein [Nocardiopsis mwathae]MBB6173844.1 putative ABC transport system ATP-binding protein [Nocardiopsis mwathae]